MRDFATSYSALFEEIGRPLAKQDACPETRILAAEERLAIRAPRSLREYYLVAGKEDSFNRIHNHLLPPEKWFVDGGYLAFMEENQAVVFWGVEATHDPVDDPAIFQGVRGEPIEWYHEHDECSVFLSSMLLWQGAFGGAMQHTGTCEVPATFANRIGRSWTSKGEVNGMRAYHRPGQVVCFLEWGDPTSRARKTAAWRIFAGASTAEELRTLAKDLEVTLGESG